jgi:hypothetical protein
MSTTIETTERELLQKREEYDAYKEEEYDARREIAEIMERDWDFERACFRN